MQNSQIKLSLPLHQGKGNRHRQPFLWHYPDWGILISVTTHNINRCTCQIQVWRFVWSILIMYMFVERGYRMLNLRQCTMIVV